MMIEDTDDDYLNKSSSIKVIEIITIVFSIISMLFSFSIVFILLYRRKKLLHGKLNSQLVLMIAIADTFVSATFALGFPRSKSFLCILQGSVSLFFERMSWMYTDALILSCYALIILHKRMSIKYIHVIIWTVNLFWEFLPFATNVSYGRETYQPLKCDYINLNSDGHYKIWLKAQDVLAYISLLLITILLIYLYFSMNYFDNISELKLYKESMYTMLLYPLSMCVCWVILLIITNYFLFIIIVIIIIYTVDSPTMLSTIFVDN
jgi:hypothetical protein